MIIIITIIIIIEIIIIIICNFQAFPSERSKKKLCFLEVLWTSVHEQAINWK